MMINGNERREVAQRLRKAIGLHEFAEVLGFSWTDESDWVWNDVSNLVADLIEPGEPKVKCVAEVKVDGGRLEQLVHDATVELTGIDREALLALADEMGRVSSRCDFCIKNSGCDWADEIICLESHIDDYAQRIREALGAIE